MSCNVGQPDRIIRTILGLLLIIAPFVTGWALFTSPVWTAVAIIVGAVLVITGIARFCPAYWIARISTARGERS